MLAADWLSRLALIHQRDEFHSNTLLDMSIDA